MNILSSFITCYFRFNTYYRFEFVMQFIRDALTMYCFYALWNVLYSFGIGLGGTTRIQILVYGVYGAATAVFVTRDGCQTYIRERIRQGTIDGDLVKPLNLQLHLLYRDFAQKIAKFLQFTLPSLLIFSVATRLFFRPRLFDLIFFIAALILAYGILFCVNFLFGMLCFYTLSIENIYFCYTGVILFLSGQMVPLWIFPDWARRIVEFLPFRYIFDAPMSIYIGRYAPKEALLILLVQAGWLTVLWILGALSWAHVRKAIISQGG